MGILRRLPYSFSLKTLLFVVSIVAILVYQFRAERTDRRRAEIVAELAEKGCVVALGCQTPPGIAPRSAEQDVVYVKLGGYYSYSLFQELLARQRMVPGGGVTPIRPVGEDAIDLSVLPELPELRILDVADRTLTTDDLRIIGRLSRLEILAAYNTEGVTDEGLRQLAGLTNLRRLKIPNSQVTDDGLEALTDLVNLEDLSLHAAKVTGAGLRHLSNLKNLRRLSLSGTQIDDTALAHLRGLKSIEELVLTNTKITDDGLKRLQPLTKLKFLDVSRTSASLKAIEALRKNWPTRLSVIQ